MAKKQEMILFIVILFVFLCTSLACAHYEDKTDAQLHAQNILTEELKFWGYSQELTVENQPSKTIDFNEAYFFWGISTKCIEQTQ